MIQERPSFLNGCEAKEPEDVPTVSVIIPLYNKAPYIKRALDSVLAQTVQNFEVIIVNDGSTDGSEKVVEGYADPRIHLINQENQGVSAARNHGVDAARTELVAFLDADDEWLPEFLETIVRLREKYPEAGLYGTGYITVFPGNHHISRVWIPSAGDRLLTNYFQDVVNSKFSLFNSSSFATNKNIFKSIGGYSIGVRWNEDGLLLSKIAINHSVAYSPTTQSMYHQYSTNNSAALITEYLTNPIEEYFSSLKKDVLSKRRDHVSIIKYMYFGNIAALYKNIYNGHGKRARCDLMSIPSEFFRWEKLKLILMSYVPISCWRLIHKHGCELSKIKWSVFGNGQE